MKTIPITSKEEIESIIKKCDICYLGLADTDGVPYVIPMNFGYMDGVIYFHSAQTGKSIDILKRNNQVCVTFSTDHALAFQHPKVACSYRMKSKSVIAWGSVEFVEENDKKIEALNIIMSHYSDKKFEYSDPAVTNVKIWKVAVTNMTGKVFGAPHSGDYME